jgi:hypothetical protein
MAKLFRASDTAFLCALLNEFTDDWPFLHFLRLQHLKPLLVLPEEEDAASLEEEKEEEDAASPWWLTVPLRLLSDPLLPLPGGIEAMTERWRGMPYSQKQLYDEHSGIYWRHTLAVRASFLLGLNDRCGSDSLFVFPLEIAELIVQNVTFTLLHSGRSKKLGASELPFKRRSGWTWSTFDQPPLWNDQPDAFHPLRSAS